MKFNDIISGKGEFYTSEFFGEETQGKENQSPIICQDGTSLSVQCSRFHYCTPKDNDGPYTEVEVGYLSEDPPEMWKLYADGPYPALVYGCVPIGLVRAYIEAHGGEVAGACLDCKTEMWYHFRMHRIYENGEMEIHMDTVTTPQEDAIDPTDLRVLADDLIDLPGDGLCLWEGYARAASEGLARDIVEAAY